MENEVLGKNAKTVCFLRGKYMIAKANASMIVGARQHVKWPVLISVTRHTPHVVSHHHTPHVVSHHHTPLNKLDKKKTFTIDF